MVFISVTKIPERTATLEVEMFISVYRLGGHSPKWIAPLAWQLMKVAGHVMEREKTRRVGRHTAYTTSPFARIVSEGKPLMT